MTLASDLRRIADNLSRAWFHDIDGPHAAAAIRRATDALDAHAEEVAGLRARVRYYEETLCMGRMLALRDGGKTGAIEPERVGAVLAERDRLREVLESLEWASTDYDYDERPSICPMCRHTEPTHSATCRLAAALRTTP